MAKIIFDYINAAEQMAKKGDYEAALNYWFLQRNKERTDEIDLSIANTYMSMGLVSEAVRFFLKVHAHDPQNIEALGGLILCFKDVDDDAAYYYLGEIANSESEYFDLEDALFSEFEEPLTVHDRRDKSEALDRAFSLIDGGDNDGAMEILDTIGKDSFQYGDALLARATLLLDSGKAKEAIAIADEVIASENPPIGAHILKIMAYEALGDKDSVEKGINALDALDPHSEDDVTKVALCLSNYNNYDLAEKYLLRKLEFSPYDKMTLMCLTSVQSAKGDAQAAFKTANRLCSVYPDDVEIKEITSRILSDCSVRIPDELYNLRRDWSEHLKNIFIEDFKSITEPENIRRVKWLLQSKDNLYLQSGIAVFVAGLPEFDSLIDDFLMNPFAPIIVKKQILLRRVPDEKVKKINIVVSNIFRSLKVRHPKVADSLKYAYYYVFIACAVTEIRFENKLNSALRKLTLRYEQLSSAQKAELSINALAAVLSDMAVGGAKEETCGCYDCEEADFERALALLGFPEKK